jgi:signal transduction histidine kinase
MRITVKQQVLFAPAAVLILLVLLLAFMQYTYWDLARKREQAKAIGTTFIAVAEADMSARRLQLLLRTIQHTGRAAPEEMALVADLYERLQGAVERIEPFGPLKDSGQIALLENLARQLNPANSPEPEEIAAIFARFRAELSTLSNITQIESNRLRHVQAEEVSTLVKKTVVSSMVVLVAAILIGFYLSFYFSRRLLSRIQNLSQNAVNIADGKLELPDVPEHVNDELDALALSINRMSKRLIRVVGTEKLLEGAEEERRRIAMDLHDQSLADLSTVLRGLQSLEHELSDPKSSEMAAALTGNLERSIANLRDIMNNLHPQTLDILGLAAAIEAHLEQHCQASGLPEYHFYADPQINDLELNRITQLSLYRIAVEAIQNVIKHAAAERYEINLEKREDALILAVEDNGRGLPEDQLRPQGRGLNNIRERARAIGAKVSWTASRFYSGTRFELSLPLN